MATEESPLYSQSTSSEPTNHPRVTVEHLSIIPVVGALFAIVGSEQWTWPTAAVLLGIAYLLVFVRVRHLRQNSS